MTAQEPPPQTQELQPPPEPATPPAPPAASDYVVEFLVEIDGYHALIRGEHLSPTDVLAWTKKTIAGFKQQGFVNVRRDTVVNVAAPPAPPAPRPAPSRPAPQRPVQAESPEEYDERRAAPARPPQRQQGGGGYQRGNQGNRQQQRSGGGGGNRGGGGGGAYHGEVYQACPECGGYIWDNRQKKAREGWKGPFFSCKDQDDCGWVVWKGDGTY